MRTFILTILLGICSHTLIGQSMVRLVDETTGEPLCGVYSNILKNIYSFNNCSRTNPGGYQRLKVRDYDSTAVYHYSVNSLEYESVFREFDPAKPDTLLIKLKRDDYYIARTPELFTNSCGLRWFMDYTPRVIHTMDSLPSTIRQRAEAHLLQRVGQVNRQKFTMIQGQVMNLEKYKRLFPNNGETVEYYLCFAFRDLKAGIDMYTSRISLGADGEILEELKFPRINPGQEIDMFPMSEAIVRAKERGFYKEKWHTEVDLEYLESENVMAWKFTNTFPALDDKQEEGNHIQSNIYYNAHTGEFIKTSSERMLIISCE